MPLLALVALFIVVPLAELYVILKVGDAIGAVWTILLLAADSVLGSLLLRSQGRSVWRRFNATLTEGRMPHREVIDGVLVIFGGAFLVTPGFLTDIVGLALLLPPGGAAVRRGRQRERVRGAAAGARAVSEAPLALSFFDQAQEIHGTARSGATILFEAGRPSAFSEGPAFEPDGEGWRARLAERLSLAIEPLTEAVDLGGTSARVCRVQGDAA